MSEVSSGNLCAPLQYSGLKKYEVQHAFRGPEGVIVALVNPQDEWAAPFIFFLLISRH